MSRRYGARLTRLEDQLAGPAVDLAAEAARFGVLEWSACGVRCYSQQTPAGARLAVVGAAGPLVYEMPGITLGDLR